MSRKKLVLIMIAAAVLLGALALMTDLFPAWLSSILAFPLEPVSLGLKALAETGRIGNGAAVMLSAALILLPLFFALRLRGKDKRPEAISLVMLSGVILVALYGAWNPGAFRNRLFSQTEEYVSALHMTLSLSVWVMVILFFVLRLIRLFRAGHRAQLLRYFRCLLYALCIVLSAGFAGSLVTDVMKLVKGLPTLEDTAFHVLEMLVSLAAFLLNVAVAFRMLDLLDTAATEEQEGLPEAASRLSRISCTALACTVFFTAALHIIRIALFPNLTDIKATAEVPLASIIFVVVILLLSRLLTENKELRDDNSMFI